MKRRERKNTHTLIIVSHCHYSTPQHSQHSNSDYSLSTPDSKHSQAGIWIPTVTRPSAAGFTNLSKREQGTCLFTRQAGPYPMEWTCLMYPWWSRCDETDSSKETFEVVSAWLWRFRRMEYLHRRQDLRHFKWSALDASVGHLLRKVSFFKCRNMCSLACACLCSTSLSW